jgi:hypothetical protein
MTRTPARPSSLRIGVLSILAASFGCATVKPTVGTSLVPTQYQTRIGPYCVFTNNPLPSDAPALRHLQSLERQVETSLGLRVPPNTDPIEVYILDNPDSFRHFLMFYFPELPTRRAFFLAQGNRRVVYTYQGSRLEEDLRHEATHALLHAGVPDLPLWLDEGLAEYFEVDESLAGRNAEHLGRLPDDFEDGFTPDLKRLEAIKDVRKMTPRDYRESWGWVHLCLNGPSSGKSALIAFLADQRAGGEVAPLSSRLQDGQLDPSARLIAHVEATRRAGLVRSGDALDREATVRFQDNAAEARPTGQGRRRGLFGRLVGLLGF